MVDAVFDHHHDRSREASYLGARFKSFADEFTCRHNATDETASFGFHRIHQPAGHAHLHGLGLANEPC
jgi:hypothetical protein